MWWRAVMNQRINLKGFKGTKCVTHATYASKTKFTKPLKKKSEIKNKKIK